MSVRAGGTSVRPAGGAAGSDGMADRAGQSEITRGAWHNGQPRGERQRSRHATPVNRLTLR